MPEYLGGFGDRTPRGSEQVIGLGDHLHIGVLDPVVNHLYVVAASPRPDPVTARLAVRLGRDRGQRLGHDLPSHRPPA